MPVFTPETLRDELGERVFMGLADLDRDRTLSDAEEQRVVNCIAAGEGDINSRIKGKYETLAASPTHEYREAILDAIIFRLQPRGQSLTADVLKRYDLALSWASKVKCDEAQISVDVLPLRRTPAATQTGPGRKFTAAKLADVL